MNLKKCSLAIVALLSAAMTFLATPKADAFAYHVVLNTTSLLSDASAPFALDLVLTGGNALSNTVVLSNLTFVGGGSANSNPAAAPIGLAAGTLTTTVSLSDSTSSFYNEFYQGFTPGTFLSFDLTVTTNLNGPTPDALSIAILDKDLLNITTNGPGDALVVFNINSAAPTAQTYTSTNGVTATVVPEPSSALLCGSVIAGACGFIRRRRA